MYKHIYVYINKEVCSKKDEYYKVTTSSVIQSELFYSNVFTILDRSNKSGCREYPTILKIFKSFHDEKNFENGTKFD